MFGESESESPRVPSPWDSLISTPASSSPSTRPLVSSSPLASTIPKLVPEADDGNVEYKLQLLSPSPARFTRLVTQLKWRLLEGGGQAYYELGVADSGALVGLPRAELEQTLETLEMMAGEIGASVIVVKEIEVPAAMADIAALQEDNRRVRRVIGEEEYGGDSAGATTTETETSATDDDDDGSVLAAGVGKALCSFVDSEGEQPVFAMDLEPDSTGNADAEADSCEEATMPQFSVDLEIASVFKPRPVRTRLHNSHLLLGDHKRSTRGPKVKKQKHQRVASNPTAITPDQNHDKGHHRKETRDRRRDEKRQALLAFANDSLHEQPSVAESESRQATLLAPVLAAEEKDALVSGLESLHVTLDEPVSQITADEAIPSINLTTEPEEDIEEEDDVFATPSVPHAVFSSPSTLSPDTEGNKGTEGQTRFIVEALVVRKMSLEEAFLDFGGFSLI